MGGGGEKTVQTTTQELSPEQRELLSGVIPIAKDTLANLPQQYPGTAIAPQTPAEQQAQQMALQSAGSMGGFTNQLPEMLRGILAGQGNNVNQAGANAGQSQADLMTMLQGMVGGTTGQIQQGNAQTSQALGTLMSPDILKASSNPALQSYMDAAIRPLTDQFANTTMPGIAGEAITAGGYGGSRQGIAEGLAARGLSQSSGDVTARIASEGYGQGLTAMLGGVNAANTQQGNTLDALSKMFGTGVQGILGGGANATAASAQQSGALGEMMKGLGMSPDILASMTKPAEVVGAVGAQQRAEQQAQLTETVQRFINEQMLPFTMAQQVAGMAFGMPGGTTTSTGQTTGGSAGLGQGLGALMSLFSLIPGLSDRRLKENIRKIGKLTDGLIVYSYNFIGDARTRIRAGLMADEVIKKYPNAVTIGKDGYQRVSYWLIPAWRGEEEYL